MQHVDWFDAILWLALLVAISQAWVDNARLKRVQAQMRALLRHLNVADPTAFPPPSARVREALERRGRFAAVKAYQEETGAGIKACKDVVDEMQEDAAWQRRRRPE